MFNSVSYFTNAIQRVQVVKRMEKKEEKTSPGPQQDEESPKSS